MNAPAPQAMTRTAVISSVSVHLAECLKDSLLITLCVDEATPCLIWLKWRETLVGASDHTLNQSINLREGSILSVQVQKKRRLRRYQTLVQLGLSVENIWPAQVDRNLDPHPRKYPIHLLNRKQQIWLNIDVHGQDNMVKTSPACTSNPDPEIVVKRGILNDTFQSLHNLHDALDGILQAEDPLGKLANAVSELYPIAMTIVERVRVVNDEITARDELRKEIIALAESMSRTLTLIPMVDGAQPNELQITLKAFPNLMNDTICFIEQWLQNAKAHLIDVFENRTKVENLKGRHTVFEEAVTRKTERLNTNAVDHMAKSQQLDEIRRRLGGFPEVKSRANICMAGTRLHILADVENRIKESIDQNLILIHGAPGSGKSSVSLTIKLRLHKQGRLLTYFRFDRTDSAVTTSAALWRRVAYDLADQYDSVRGSILPLLRSNRVDVTSATDLFASLIEEPLSQLPDTPPDNPFIIVLDALDECGGFESRSSPDRRDLLRTLRKWPRVPKQFKIIVTSREEADVMRMLHPISTTIEIPSGNLLTDNPDAQTSIDACRDVQMFLLDRFSQIRESIPSLPPEWPGRDMIARMVRRAAGNFMWVTAATNFVDSGHPQDQLERIMAKHPESAGMKPLYSLYSTILEASLGSFMKNTSIAEVVRAVLGTIVLAQRPFLDIECTKLPTSKPVDMIMIESIRERLRTVVDPDPMLRFVHKSFDDFLLSEECPLEYRIEMDECQYILAKLCSTTMTAGLRFNMCNLETSYMRNVDVPDIETKVREGIPRLLSYSCRFWADHLIYTPFDDDLMGMFREMMLDKLLYWFEAMSLLKEMNRVPSSLLSLLKWAHPSPDDVFKDFLRDARRFIGAFGHPISQSAPHTYISALPFAPEHSSVAITFLPRFPNVLSLLAGRSTDWPPRTFTSEHHEDFVESVAFSPDEKYFVSGSHAGTLFICDSETGNMVSGPLYIPGLTCVFFDPDGRRVWGSSKNGEVISWDIETGDEQIRFQAGSWKDPTRNLIGCCYLNSGQSNIVSTSTWEGTVTLWNSVTGERLGNLPDISTGIEAAWVRFSSDGLYMAVTGYDYKAVRIWNLMDGTETQGSSQSNHIITALSFAVDSHFVVIGCLGGTIFIRNAETGDLIDRPLYTCKDVINAVAYSHTHRLLVSASDNPVVMTVWDAITQQIVLGPLECHTSRIWALSLSRDAQKALSGSHDGTVTMWDLGRKGTLPMASVTESHAEGVRCVAFSPCGARLASLGGDAAIKIWDVSNGKLLGNIVFDHPSYYSKIIFSPDGGWVVAFGSGDAAVHLGVWNTDTGVPLLIRNITDHKEYKNNDYVDHIAFRSTDKRLITFSCNSVVRVWNLEPEGSVIVDESVESTHHVKNIIALSPDGLTALIRDPSPDDAGLPSRHYIWSTTTCQSSSVTFIDTKYMSGYYTRPYGYLAAFSPSGQLFASTAYHYHRKYSAGKAPARMTTLRVWNTQTGELVAGPSTFDGHLVSMSFSPDDCHIAISYSGHSNSNKTAIQLWNGRIGSSASRHWKRHPGEVRALAFSSDGKRLASGLHDGQIKIWHTLELLGNSQPPFGFLRVGKNMKDGWIIKEDGKLLFWVPRDRRSRLVWPGDVVMIGGSGMATELDLKRFKCGDSWAECFEAQQ